MQGQSSSAQALTNVLDCLHEPGADVRFVVILYGDALVLVVPLEMVGAVRGDVQQGCDAQSVKHVPPGSVVGAAKVEKGKDFHGATLLQRKTTHMGGSPGDSSGQDAHPDGLEALSSAGAWHLIPQKREQRLPF